MLSRTSSLGHINANKVPHWGRVSAHASAHKRSIDGFSSKSTFYQRDLLNVKAVAMSRSPLFNKKLYTEIFESLPAMRHERDNMVAESYTSDEEAGSKSLDQGSFDSYMQQHEGHLHSMNEKSMVALNKLPVNKQKLLDSTYLIKKLRDEAFLSDITSIDKLEELFFQHDSTLFKVSVSPENVQESKPQPSSTNVAGATSSNNSVQRPIASKAILMPSSDSGKREDSGKGSAGSRLGIAEAGSSGPPGSPNTQNSANLSTSDAIASQRPVDPVAGPARGPINSRDLWLRNRHQQQLAQRNLETKKALMNASKPNAAAGSAVAKKGLTTLEYLQEYCKSYGINPFKQKEGKKYLSQMSHNRRRWSHVFPLGKTMADLGLNWKSLTQPAILPLNTDYLPSVVDLKDRFEVTTYTIQFMASESPFNTLEDALRELVCQRLTHEFQLVEGRDQSPYMRLNNKYTLGSQQNFFILTMGHRIQFLYGDSATSEVSTYLFELKLRKYVIYLGSNSLFLGVLLYRYRFPSTLAREERTATSNQRTRKEMTRPVLHIVTKCGCPSYSGLRPLCKVFISFLRQS
ncbi:hypothetical protein EON65_06340 [archaeon]|nr:MAG: hypothetical protein EON65_06340 [archaeon]